MPYFVALDAGGTKTRCWIADEGRVLGRSTGGTVKIMNVGEEAATQRLREIVTEAAEKAGISLSNVERTCMGLAGIGSESVRHWAEQTLHELVPGEVMLCGDEAIALDAAFQGRPGVLVIAGTGSNVVGRCSDGSRVTAGGWGPVVGDEGSGTWIGLEAVRAGLWAYDRGIETSLLDQVRAFWGLRTLGELIAKVNHQVRTDFAALTTVVAQCAADGDAFATNVLKRAGEELAEQVTLVLTKMKKCGCPASDGRRVAFTGSVLEKVPLVHESMQATLHAAFPGLEVAKEAVEPLDGALWRARGCVREQRERAVPAGTLP